MEVQVDGKGVIHAYEGGNNVASFTSRFDTNNKWFYIEFQYGLTDTSSSSSNGRIEVYADDRRVFESKLTWRSLGPTKVNVSGAIRVYIKIINANEESRGFYANVKAYVEDS